MRRSECAMGAGVHLQTGSQAMTPEREYTLPLVVSVLLFIGFIMFLAGCTVRDPGVSRERELVAAQALAEIQESAQALTMPELSDEARQAIPAAQERWAERGLRALHAEVDDAR